MCAFLTIINLLPYFAFYIMANKWTLAFFTTWGGGALKYFGVHTRVKENA